MNVGFGWFWKLWFPIPKTLKFWFPIPKTVKLCEEGFQFLIHTPAKSLIQGVEAPPIVPRPIHWGRRDRRALILVLLVAARAGWWVLEQPSTSIMELHPLFQQMLQLLPGVRRKMINMSSYGAPTRKRTILYPSSITTN